MSGITVVFLLAMLWHWKSFLFLCYVADFNDLNKNNQIHGRWFMINAALTSTTPGKIPEFFQIFLERKYQFPLLRSIKSDPMMIFGWVIQIMHCSSSSPLILRILDKIRWFNRYTTGRSYFLRHPNFSEKRASPAHESFYCIPSCLNKKQRNLLNSKKT